MEAARIDGAEALRFFGDVVLSLSRSNIAALFVILFIYGWNQYLWPLLITTEKKMYTVVMGIHRNRKTHFMQQLKKSHSCTGKVLQDSAGRFFNFYCSSRFVRPLEVSVFLAPLAALWPWITWSRLVTTLATSTAWACSSSAEAAASSVKLECSCTIRST